MLAAQKSARRQFSKGILLCNSADAFYCSIEADVVMQRLISFGWASAGSLACTVGFFLFITGALAQSPAPDPASAPPPAVTAPAEPPWQQLLEAQQAILKATEQSRHDAALAAKNQADMIARRIDKLNLSLDSERDREWESILRTHQLALGVASVIAGVTLIGLLLSVLLHVRAMRKLTAAVNASLVVGPPHTHLLESIARIENQLLELERSLASPPEPEAKDAAHMERTAEVSKPRMALSLGEGDALNFLPSEIKRGPRRSLLARLKKLFPHLRHRTDPAAH